MLSELKSYTRKFPNAQSSVYAWSSPILIIYSNGTRETFNQNNVVEINSETQTTERKQSSGKEDINLKTPISASNSYSNPNQGNRNTTSKPNSNSFQFNDGDKFLGIGLGTGAFLGNSSAIATVNIPYISARFDKVYFQFGENMALGAGLYTAYHAYSIGDFGNESIFNIISGGLSGSYYYNISEKLALGVGVRVLYVTIATSESYGYTIGPVSNIDLFVFASAYYNVAKKLNLFSEFSSGISNINLGSQFKF
nr:hypothetical protein [Cytophagales bacterium]